MYPQLFELGPFTLRTLSVMMVLAFFITAFLFWRKGREEHYPEIELIDGFLMAVLIGFVFGRAGYIVAEIGIFGFSVLKWLDVFGYPGLNGAMGTIAATIYLFRHAKKQKWDPFEILDFWALALAGGLSIGYLGLFFDGSVFGLQTDLPMGITFPGLQEPHHPTALYFSIFFLALSWYLSWVEYRYRTFEWYRAGKKTAQTGFLISIFLIVSAIFFFAMTWLKPPIFSFFDVNADRLLTLVAIFFGLGLLWNRSGRNFRPRRKPPTSLTIEDLHVAS